MIGKLNEDRFPTADLDIPVPPTTFCAWWLPQAKIWSHGDVRYPPMGALDDDGARFLINRLDPSRFVERFGWDETAVSGVFETNQCDEAIARRLDPTVSWPDLEPAIRELTQRF